MQHSLVREIKKITADSERYPPLLREIAYSPELFYICGNSDVLHHPHLLAVVGSRKATSYGQRAARELLVPLTKAGLILVSGLAHGIDSLAHTICLEQGQPTIAVLGSGLDEASLYPRTNVALARKIVDGGGALISEYPVGTKALPAYFPARNRIVAGLCKATLVIQAAAKSGSLITARLALDANREVLAVPGSITDPLSAGTNNLIKQGALPITGAEDILNLYELTPALANASSEALLTADQERIVKRLSAEPQHIDGLIQEVRLPSEIIASLLIELEMIGLVENIGGMRYIRK